MSHTANPEWFAVGAASWNVCVPKENSGKCLELSSQRLGHTSAKTWNFPVGVLSENVM